MTFILMFIIGIAPTDTLELSLYQAIDYALQNNPGIEQLTLDTGTAQAMLDEARSAFYPSITASGYYAYISDVAVFELDSILIPMGQHENYNYQVSLQQVLFTWGKIYNAYKISDLGKDIAQLDLVRKKQDVRYSVTDAFYGILILKEIVTLSRESLVQLERHAKSVETRYRAGLVPQFELLRAQVQVANVKPQLIKAENGLKLAREGFKMLLGLPLHQEFKLTGELQMADEEFNIDDLTAAAIGNRVELKNLKKYARITELSKQIAARANLPSLVAGATYARTKPFGFGGDDWGTNITFNVGFDFPIFSGFRNVAQYKQATLQVKGAQLAFENLEKGIILEVKQAFYNFQAAKQSIAAAQDNVTQAEKTYNIIDIRYRNGLATNLEFMDVQLAAMQARTNYLSALKNYYTAKAEIKKATGKEE
ncbi:MAG: TolC family protein [bacterium]